MAKLWKIHIMAYTTVAAVKQNHERIPDDLPAAEQALEDAAIAAFIADADAIINARIRGKVTLPVTSTPALLAFISKSFATFFELRRLFGAQVEEYHQWVQDYWDKAMQILEDVAECKYNFDSDVAAQYDLLASNTQGKQAIFDLGEVYDQAYHDDGDDDRYGE